MKKILGLDLGVTSIGWAVVNEAENPEEKSSIIKLGVRVNPLTVDEKFNFEQGKSITTNADRTLKRSMRRNLQRYKLRRESLISTLKEYNLLENNSILCEDGANSTFETCKLRAKAVTEEISLGELSRVLLMINKKRGYKSNRKAKNSDEDVTLFDGSEIAKKLISNNSTPSEYIYNLLQKCNKNTPDIYRCFYEDEFLKIWEFQKKYFPLILSDELKNKLKDKTKTVSNSIFRNIGVYTVDNKGKDRLINAYKLRVDALTKALSIEEIAFVLCEVNGSISNSGKNIFLNGKTVGQYQMDLLLDNPHNSLQNQVFYRQDYLEEFNKIWDNQAEYHKELTLELKKKIRDIIIFYQRPLKSQKGLVNYCELENETKRVIVDGKEKNITIGSKTIPKSSPLFQEFKIWQILNNIIIKDKTKGSLIEGGSRFLTLSEKDILAEELSTKSKLSKKEALSILFKDTKNLDLNYKDIEGNKTQEIIFSKLSKIIDISGHGEHDFKSMRSNEIYSMIEDIFSTLGYNTEILKFNSDIKDKTIFSQSNYKLWHLLYSYQGDSSKSGNNALIEKLSREYGFSEEAAQILSSIDFTPDYGSLSAKAIRKILPFMKEGLEYSAACIEAGYNHSKNSLTKEEIENKVLLERLELLPKNSLRNPVVEKIINQMINVINSIINEYGEIDEIRIELARELKKSMQERESMTKSIRESNTNHDKIKETLMQDFGLSSVSRNDIIRYKLYKELEPLNYHTLYSNTYIPREILFSKDLDIEHIIPQSRLFDDSFSNKTLEMRSINIEKGNKTAYDYILDKYGEIGLDEYEGRLDKLAKNISKGKLNKLKMRENEIPKDFIERDLRDSQYIAKKAKSILLDLVKTVTTTTGSVTDRLRNDWQLVNVMQELNWNKYNKLGLTKYIKDKDGKDIPKIENWTKRNDHRHHAMDALTIAFTKPSYIQYLNNLNARSNKEGSIYGIEKKELTRNDHGKLIFKSPIKEFRAEAKKHLEETLISIKAKNKVVTRNINKTKKKSGTHSKVQLTPRGQLHNETIYKRLLQYETKEVKINASFTKDIIEKVASMKFKIALLARLEEFGGDPKKAFTGKNSLEKNPIYLNGSNESIPLKVKLVELADVFTIRKEITPDIKLDKVIDSGIRKILLARLNEYNNNPKEAFANLEDNPIWFNKEKGITIKSVAIKGVNNTVALHDKKDKNGNNITSKGISSVDFVSTSNNHHVAIYRDAQGKLQESVISFYETVIRANNREPIVDKEFNKHLGWEFLFTMKRNEYFVFPNTETGFNPNEIDLMKPENYNIISPNLYRVQKIATKNYMFRHHLETSVEDNKELVDIAYKSIRTPSNLENIIKVRINHLGNIVSIGEYR